MRVCWVSSQSSASYASHSFTARSRNTAPKVVLAVSSSTARTKPSLDRGAINRSTIIATTKSQCRRDAAPFAVLRISRSSAIRRSVPSTAATWPCGRDRATRISSGPVPITVPPLSNAFSPVDDVARQLAQIGQGALLRTTLLVTVALPQQHRRRRGPVRHGLDEHRRIGSHRRRFGNPY